VAVALKTPVAEAAASLRSADALWMDETHYPREGIGNWVWAAVQPLLAVFAIYPSRARYVILDFIGDKCTAAVTSDRYAGYAFIDAERRQVCWAHLLRDFNRIGQRSGLAGQIGRRLLGLGLVMFRKRDKGQLGGARSTACSVESAWRCNAARNRPAARRTANTCANILKLCGRRCGPSRPTTTLVPTNNAASRRCAASCSSARSPGPRARAGVMSS
jgi:transposase